ncbi:integrin beta-1 [Acropora millepora]|uniref:integrin beta-1 n=1 Tax=Acropora millepora TaxID=45264 RepID=UPI001CF2A12B|nr:integrin beta-1 [Acropora millepora]
MKRRLCLLVSIFLYWGYFCTPAVDACTRLTKCNQCIGEANCAWCSDKDFGSSRCDSQKILELNGCSNISNPKSESNIQQDSNVGAKVQVQPKKIRLNLRAGNPAKFTLTVRPAENYPVDLYYLMDMSSSMKDDLGNLRSLAGQMATTMKEITSNFKLGFGSFVDKAVSPFVRTELKLPCDNNSCVATYGFKNVLPLVNDTVEFQTKINQQIISGNLDAPEGGFDALMQVAACEKEIGWSRNGTSRRLVVFATDDSFHIAGDGKLGGIVTPNDGKCHLDSNGYYTKSKDQDYPSIAQLHEKLQESNVLPIFAVTKQFASLYKSVSTMWSDLGAVTGTLATDSDNVVELIKNKYEEIVSTVSLVYKEPERVSVTVKANCGPNSVNTQTRMCSNVKLGQKVSFDVSVKLEGCPTKDADKAKSFVVRVPGFGSVELELNYICQCDCEQADRKEYNSSACNKLGALTCGLCACNEGRFGKFCQCDTPFSKTEQDKCKSSNSTDEPLCSGRGECACGECVCRVEQGQRFYGKLCECNDFSCPEYEGNLCGGAERGVCRCRKCQCKDKYHGDACDQKNCTFFPPETICKQDAKSEMCGGADRGRCVKDSVNCYKCQCNKEFDGTYCENCPNCENGMCTRNVDCALCSTFQGKSLKECKQSGKCEENVLEVQIVDDIKKKTDEGLYRCEGIDGQDGCTYYFTTETEADSKNFVLYVQKDKVSCPTEAPVLPIVLGVVGGILFLGLLILIVIKALFTMVDRIEYQKFERERMHSKWTREKNPLYQAAKTTFENPTYAGGRQ